MTAWKRGHSLPPGAEIALAYAVGAAAFVVVAVTLSGVDSGVVVVLLAVPFIAAVVAVARHWSVAYAVPIAMAGLLAYDWYYLPPTHPLEFPDSANLVDLLAVLAVAVLLGQLAAQGARRAEASERALGAIAEEQAALRSLATLVAQGVPASELFAAVAEKAGTLLGVDGARIARYVDEEAIVHVAEWSAAGDELPAYDRATLEGPSVSAEVLRTGRVARIDNYDDIPVPAPFARGMEAKSVVGAPIVVEGHLWGVMVAWSESEALPNDAEARLTDFTELVATAISNTEARAEIGRLVEEQVALRHVATLVARDVPPSELFGAVAAEVGGLLGGDLAGMIRYERDGTVMAVATWAAEGEHPAVPGPFPLEGGAATMVKTRRPVREDDWSEVSGPLAEFVREMGIRSSVGSPIVVGDRVWGAVIVHSKQAQPLSPDTEPRLTNFTELVGTAISNAEARAETTRLADEQAALRRVATLVARATPPAEIFSAVATEVGAVFGADSAGFARNEPGGMATIVAIEPKVEGLPVGKPLKLGRGTAVAEVLLTGRPIRIDDYSDASGPLADVKDRMRLRSSVGCPILVEDRLWGALVVGSRGDPLPADTESHLTNFTDLVATAVANAESRAEVAASRARIVAATDDERRRVVRDLHDGAQQRLVHTLIKLKQARSALREEEEAATLVGEALEQAEQANAELRELAHGILPAVLTRGGLNAGVDALASRMPVPVEIGVSVGRLPSAVEATAYFVVAEALTNVAKHARAEHAAVIARVEDGTLRVQVRDDGVGGARADGTGLLGLRDRVAAQDGSLQVESPAEGGTLVAAAIPLNGAGGSTT